MPANPLLNFNILVIDADVQLGNVLQGILATMGFPNISFTSNGQDALKMLAETPYDFILSEWNIKGIDGLELLTRIRRDTHSPDQTLPVIMLSGRAEHNDVITARDYGINEYVIKPFTAKTIFSRLERLIDIPKNFIITPDFVGPDRRNNISGALPKDMASDRRKTVIPSHKRPSKAVETATDRFRPKVWTADTTLKQKLGNNTMFSSVVTAPIVASAQQGIEAKTEESATWLQENLSQLHLLQEKMKGGDLYTLLPMDMSETALTLSTRSGTFGNMNASQVAYLLYLFCRNHLRPGETSHQRVAQQHIDALRTTLTAPKRADAAKQGAEMVKELKKLVEKFAA